MHSLFGSIKYPKTHKHTNVNNVRVPGCGTCMCSPVASISVLRCHSEESCNIVVNEFPIKYICVNWSTGFWHQEFSNSTGEKNSTLLLVLIRHYEVLYGIHWHLLPQARRIIFFPTRIPGKISAWWFPSFAISASVLGLLDSIPMIKLQKHTWLVMFFLSFNQSELLWLQHVQGMNSLWAETQPLDKCIPPKIDS